jgi:hypothetical protein
MAEDPELEAVRRAITPGTTRSIKRTLCACLLMRAARRRAGTATDSGSSSGRWRTKIALAAIPVALADYTVTWSDIAPTNDIHPEDFTWQVSGTTGDSSGPISRQTFPFTQSFLADFPLPDPVDPGQYRFRLTVTATERDVKNPGAKLTASVVQGVVVHVQKDPKGKP